MNLKLSLVLTSSLLLLALAEGTEASAASRCKSELLKGTLTESPPLKHLVLDIVTREYIQKRADLASESPKEQALVVQDLRLEAARIFDDILENPPEDLAGLETSLLAQQLIKTMKARDLHYLEERRLLHFYENLIGYLTSSFRWKIQAAQSKRFLNGTQQDAEKEFVTEIVNDQIVRAFLQGFFDRSRNDVQSEKSKFFFLSLVLSGKIKDALRKHLAPTRTSEKAEFSIDSTFNLKSKIEKAKFDKESASFLEKALSELRADEREIIEVIYYRGLSLQQAALHLEKPLGSLKSTLSRSLTKLRLKLAPMKID